MAMMNMGWMKGSGTEVANYFMGGNAADYYLDENDPSYWLGKDAHRAGFTGLVTKKDLKAALSNRTAYGGKLTRRDVDNRRAGLEVVLSEPKTVSMMYARLAEDVKLKISQEGIGYSVAYILSKADHDKQRELLRLMLANRWTRAQLEKAMKPDANRSLSYTKDVKITVSLPKACGYAELKTALENLVKEVTKWEKQNVQFELLPKMLM